MAKGKKGKKSKQDEDAEWDALEAKKTAQAAEPKPAAEPKKGRESLKISRSCDPNFIFRKRQKVQSRCLHGRS